MEKQGKSAYHLKDISLIFKAHEQSEGVGAKVRRFIGIDKNPRLDPFLMLDLFNVKLPAGFPDHPHRGFETVTYMLSGQVVHEDFKGHKGELGPGDLQWMTAGKGIVHAEMPASFDEPAYGFQLWINLEKKNKLCEPQYQEFKASQIPLYDGGNFKAKVIAGDIFGVKGPITVRTPAYYLDLHTDEANTSYAHLIPQGWNSMVVVYQGQLRVQDEEEVLEEGKAVVFDISADRDEEIKFNSVATGTRFILLAGKPINEEVKQYGPFVMSSGDEIMQALEDFQGARNGFEGSRTWKSQIRNLAKQKR